VLEDKVVLVTGGAGGLGAAVCRTLSREGAIPVVADLRIEQTQALAGELGCAFGVALDVTDETSVARVVDSTLQRYGRIDALVNSAGVDVTLPIEKLSIADFDRVAGVNLRGPFLMSKAVFEPMKARGEGAIVNIVSTAAKRAWAEASAYHASKWGLLGLSHALHVEGRQQGIKVTAVITGGMRTPFLFDRFPDIDACTLQPPENVAETVRFVLCQPVDTVVPEITVIPMKETSWP